MALNPVKTPFTNMSFTPDVPAAALGPNEYNSGQNVETDTRGIKKVLGDQAILNQIPGQVVYVAANFRIGTQFWFIVANNSGSWYGITTSGITNLTPTVSSYISNQYSYNTRFTSSWNGDVLFVNDTVNPPMYLLPTDTEFRLYDTSYPDQSPNIYVWNYYINQSNVYATFGANTANVTASFTQAGANVLASFANNIMTITAINSGSIQPTQTVIGNGIPGGTTVTAGSGATWLLSANVGNVALELVNTIGGNATMAVHYINNGTVNLGQNISGAGIPANTAIVAGPDSTGLNWQVNANINIPTYETVLCAGNSTISTMTVANVANGIVQVGQTITGAGIPANTTIISGSGTSFIANANLNIVNPEPVSTVGPNSWTNLTAGFVRVYASPNVGSLLIAGNLTYNVAGTTYNLPNTVRWSQGFGLNSGPTTWAPTLTNIANEVDIPLRGPAIDGFPLNGNFYVCSYWDTVVFSPIAYTSTSAPVFGIKLISQGRGLLNENCWAAVDNVVYGIDSRDVWLFDGGNFTGVGDQRVKNYLFANINTAYTNQVYMINNTKKYQIEIYYPDLNSTGLCNQMISYRYDLQVWNPPRAVTNAVFSVESPVWTAGVPNLASRGVVYAQGNITLGQLIQKDIGNAFVNNTAINSQFRRDNINFGQPYSNRIQVHRVLPEITGTGNVTVTVGGANSVGNTAVFKPPVVMNIATDNPWVQINQNDVRVTSIVVGTNDATDTWQMTEANWQISIIEDAR